MIKVESGAAERPMSQDCAFIPHAGRREGDGRQGCRRAADAFAAAAFATAALARRTIAGRALAIDINPFLSALGDGASGARSRPLKAG